MYKWKIAVGSGLLAPFYSSAMYSPYRVQVISPPRSTPSLEPDSLEYEYSSPADDDYLTTPDLAEWREIRRLEDEKERQLADEQDDAQDRFDLPALQLCKQSPVLSELPSDLPPWPHTTIAPEDAFPDYAEVRQYLQEQARPSSPFSDYALSETDSDPRSCANLGSSPENPSPPTPLPLPVRHVGQKAKREEVDDDDDTKLAPKRHKPHRVPAADVDTDIESDDDRDQGDDDGSGSFQPSPRRPVKGQRVSLSPSDRRRKKATRFPPASKPSSFKAAKCNRGEDYLEGPCSCQAKACPHCVMTCFYTFSHGHRKGEVCRRLFENGRHLDLKRHKATHAVQEWKWLEDGEISPEEASWHLVVFEGKEHGLICPNGDCSTTFTRYDALKRHMERGTCQFMHRGPVDDDLDSRQLKAKVMKASNDKYERMSEAKKTRVDRHR